jgi:ferrochelatase
MTTGVVVMSYGTPASSDGIAAFYTDVRHGRAPSPEQVERLAARYEAIGGLSPLTVRSASQVEGIRRALEGLAPGQFVTSYGTKHGRPRIEEAVDDLATAGVDAAVALVLAPHYSALSVGEYLERFGDRARQNGIAAVGTVERFGDDPTLIDLLAARVGAALRAIGTPAAATVVLFSAHSLPARIVGLGDPYPAELEVTAELVAEAAGIENFRNVWQSASPTGEPWLGPDICTVLEELAAQGSAGVVVCPAGFTSDHLEVLYDLDIVAKQRAEELGLAFARTTSLNDEPRLMEALARRIHAADPRPR